WRRRAWSWKRRTGASWTGTSRPGWRTWPCPSRPWPGWPRSWAAPRARPGTSSGPSGARAGCGTPTGTPSSAPANPSARGEVLEAGELVFLHDRAGRRYRVRLASGASLSLHSGAIAHDELIGKPDGSLVTTRQGSRLLALRPTFAELVVDRKRRAQPIYPKDLGAILVGADI